MPAPLRPAVFLDRDGTLIEEKKYLSDPALVTLLPGVGEGLRRLRDAGFELVVVTNQSGIGRGKYAEADMHACNDEMCRQLAPYDVSFAGIYFCPAAPTSGDPMAIDHPDRKPAPGMFLKAAAALNLDLARSWVIGDSPRDVVAGKNAGCVGQILVRTGHPIADPEQWRACCACAVLDDMQQAVDHILLATKRGHKASSGQ
ncbi:MAG: HAD family hydrolase [Gemmataceae bacterium]|nr:HAD family hydrolase [Gemmataceae bacterium]